MENFQSGDHIFILYNIVPRPSNKGDNTLNIILDVPFTEELLNELSHYLWKDVKLQMEKSSGGNAVQSEFYIVSVQPKDYKEGPRIRVTLRQPYDQTVFSKIGKLLFHDVKLSLEVIQEELEFDSSGDDE